jgi:hypothetical protein
MVPADFITYFSTMAAVGGTLFGLIFIVISIVPEHVVGTNAPVNKQLKAASAYTALLNPLIISLFALIPQTSIGYPALVMGLVGLSGTLGLLVSLVQAYIRWSEKLRTGIFILAGFILYGFEIFCGVRLLQVPSDLGSLYALTTILIVLYVFGISRAWDVVGASQFHLERLLATNLIERVKHNRPDSTDSENEQAESGITKSRE